MAPRSPRKDVSYHELLEALGELGCPVCRRAEESVEDAIKAILREQINDRGFRKQLLQSGGFCRQHAWRLVRHHDVLGIAILHRALLVHVATEPRKRRDSCLLCLSYETSVRIVIDLLVKNLDDQLLADSLAKSDGLCELHFERAQAASRGASLLAQAQAASRARLLQDLDELIRKQDYRFMHEPDRGEGKAWLRAVAAVSGLDIHAAPRSRSRKLPPSRQPPPG